ncbi:MAG TPA: class I SAM-dependent methyltransferase [Phycisphaerae bacterium]|nr:class I SAM-dependent methyltransferase [Phycisphaerae bacterium]
MMFGTKEHFDYAECGQCKCLYLARIPADMSKYYPSNYYSFQNATRSHYPWWMLALKRARAEYEITGRGYLGRLVSKYQGKWPYFSWFREAGLHFDSSILDVGCGRGDYLRRFYTDGFSKLTGVDPYIKGDLTLDCGVHIYKRELHEMSGQFDCIFSKDSFEHMSNPKAALQAMFGLAKPGGAALIAIPVAESDAWKEYGTNWFQIDAPRHITIPSRKSMQVLATAVGFTLEKVLFDSIEDQFLISDAYRRGIPLKQLQEQGADHLFSREERERFRKRAEAVNLSGRGDHACFVLRKPT